MKTLLSDGYIKDKPLKEKRDIKLFILYLMHSIGFPLDYAEANDIAVQGEIINPLQFAECFAELLEAGTVAEDKRQNQESQYYITSRGTHVVAELQNRLPSGLRERSLRSAMRYLSFERRGSELKFGVSERTDGRLTLNFSAIEESGPLFELSLMVPTQREADRMLFNLRDRPEEIYRNIIAVLNKPV